MTTVKKQNGKLLFENEPAEEITPSTTTIRIFYETLLLIDSVCRKTDLNRAQVVKEMVEFAHEHLEIINSKEGTT